MTRIRAREIAEKITNQQLLDMFKAAREGIKDWTKVSAVNKGITKGTAWNVLVRDFDVNHQHHIMAKTNMVREFGDFLPEELNAKKTQVKNEFKPVHREPDFDEFMKDITK